MRCKWFLANGSKHACIAQISRRMIQNIRVLAKFLDEWAKTRRGKTNFCSDESKQACGDPNVRNLAQNMAGEDKREHKCAILPRGKPYFLTNDSKPDLFGEKLDDTIST